MADVFISYSSTRRVVADALAEYIAAKGFTVWWDRKLVAGQNFDLAIERELAAARAVIVLWCPASVTSTWVRAEARFATSAAKAIPVRLAQVSLPLEFSGQHCIDWLDGEAPEQVFDALTTVIGIQGQGDPPRVDAARASLGQLFTNEALEETVEPKNEPVFSGGVDLAILDQINAKRAERIGNGHRIIFGVAGSGKTVLLQARAKALKHKDPQARVLFLCFNRALADHVRSSLEPHRVDVFHFHWWAHKVAGVNGHPLNDPSGLGEAVLASPAAKSVYSTILIDEAQDFHRTWFLAVKAALKDPENGDLLIAYDAAQSLYQRHAFTWASVGIKARGRTYSKILGLHLNYRNTREILTAAVPFAEGSVTDFSAEAAIASEDAGLSHFAEPIQADPSLATRLGPRPLLVSKGTRVEECKWVQSYVEGLVAAGVRPEDIAIIYPRQPEKYQRVMFRHKQALSNLGVGLVEIGSDGFLAVSAPGIRLMNSLQSKGLQFPHVVFMWADLLPYDGFSELQERRIMYVSLTRAEETLAISYTGSPKGRYIERLLEACRQQ